MSSSQFKTILVEQITTGDIQTRLTIARFVGLMLQFGQLCRLGLPLAGQRWYSGSSEGSLLLALKLALAYVSSFSAGNEVKLSSWSTLSCRSRTDLPSRGLTMQELATSGLWLSGPAWLKDKLYHSPDHHCRKSSEMSLRDEVERRLMVS